MPKARKANERINKSAWIRSQPATMNAKDVLQKAKKEGTRLSLAQIYTARSTAKAAGKSSRERPHAPVPPVPTAGRRLVIPSIADMQAEFERLVVRLGTDHAQRLLDSLVTSG
jgi:hypothetical protein